MLGVIVTVVTAEEFLYCRNTTGLVRCLVQSWGPLTVPCVYGIYWLSGLYRSTVLHILTVSQFEPCAHTARDHCSDDEIKIY